VPVEYHVRKVGWANLSRAYGAYLRVADGVQTACPPIASPLQDEATDKSHSIDLTSTDLGSPRTSLSSV